MGIIFKLRNYHFTSPLLTEAPVYKMNLSKTTDSSQPGFLPVLQSLHLMQQTSYGHSINSYPHQQVSEGLTPNIHALIKKNPGVFSCPFCHVWLQQRQSSIKQEVGSH